MASNCVARSFLTTARRHLRLSLFSESWAADWLAGEDIFWLGGKWKGGAEEWGLWQIRAGWWGFSLGFWSCVVAKLVEIWAWKILQTRVCLFTFVARKKVVLCGGWLPHPKFAIWCLAQIHDKFVSPIPLVKQIGVRKFPISTGTCWSAKMNVRVWDGGLCWKKEWSWGGISFRGGYRNQRKCCIYPALNTRKYVCYSFYYLSFYWPFYWWSNGCHYISIYYTIWYVGQLISM